MDTTDRIRIESHRDPDQLEREIDAQRTHIASLVSTLERRMSPGELAGSFLGAGKDGSKEFAHNLAHAVRANPMATLLTAAGMTWLYAQRDRPIERDATSTTLASTDDDPGVRERLGDKASSARDFTRRKAHEARLGFDHMLEDNPIAVGAMGVAAGALFGALLPSTEAEDRWMGEVRDRVAEDFKRNASDVTRPRADGGSRATMAH